MKSVPVVPPGVNLRTRSHQRAEAQYASRHESSQGSIISRTRGKVFFFFFFSFFFLFFFFFVLIFFLFFFVFFVLASTNNQMAAQKISDRDLLRKGSFCTAAANYCGQRRLSATHNPSHSWRPDFVANMVRQRGGAVPTIPSRETSEGVITKRPVFSGGPARPCESAVARFYDMRSATAGPQ